MRKQWNSVTKEEEGTRIRLYKQGFTITVIAKKFHRQPSAIWSFFKTRNIPIHHLQTIPSIKFILSEGEKGYIAGIIDGEGWIGEVGKTCARLTITNTTKELCDFLKRKIPWGRIYLHSKQEYEKSNKTCWQFDVGKTFVVYRLLKQIVPYLIIKREKAEQVLKQLKQFFY